MVITLKWSQIVYALLVTGGYYFASFLHKFGIQRMINFTLKQ